MGMIGHVLIVPQIDWTKTTPKGVPSQGSFTSATSSKCSTESKSVFVCVCLRECGGEVNWKVCLNSVGTARFEKVYEQYPHIEFFEKTRTRFIQHIMSCHWVMRLRLLLFYTFLLVSFSTHICNMRVSLTQPLIDLYTLKPFSGETYQFRCDVWRSINFGFNMIENSWRLKLLGSFRELGFPNPNFNTQIVRFHQMKQGNKNSNAAKFVL